jgi:chromosomal replication initiation ATPase DnaA
LERYYGAKRHSPVLGGEEFIARARVPNVKLDREIPRYHRRALQADRDQVIAQVAELYGVTKGQVLSGVRGKENEARKVAMYLVRRCCDRTLSETARLFGLGSYGAAGWVCHGMRAQLGIG